MTSETLSEVFVFLVEVSLFLQYANITKFANGKSIIFWVHAFLKKSDTAFPDLPKNAIELFLENTLENSY